jgi:hypothetical protein
MANPQLKLIARDEEDLEVLSAFLQDAVLRVRDIAYMPKARRFALMLNRYCWEDEENAERSCLRTRAGLHFESVLRVRALGIRQDEPDAVLELLAMRFSGAADGAGAIDLILAGGGRIRLDVECIDATLADLSGPWPAKGRPVHDVETG